MSEQAKYSYIISVEELNPPMAGGKYRFEAKVAKMVKHVDRAGGPSVLVLDHPIAVHWGETRAEATSQNEGRDRRVGRINRGRSRVETVTTQQPSRSTSGITISAGFTRRCA